MSARAKRVAVVDDHLLVAESIAVALTQRGFDVDVVDPGRDDLLDHLLELDLGVCFVDLDWGADRYRGVSLIAALDEAGCAPVVLTGTVHPPLFGYCLELGAVGIITKTQPFADLVSAAVRAITNGSPNTDGQKLEWIMDAQRARKERQRELQAFTKLTTAEADVLADLMVGRSVADIALARVVAVSTVRSHIKQILSKLGVNSQLAAVTLAMQSHWHRGHGDLDTPSAPELSTVAPR